MTNEFFEKLLIKYLKELDELTERFQSEFDDSYSYIIKEQSDITFIMLSTIQSEIQKNINTESSLTSQHDKTDSLPKFYFYQNSYGLPIFLYNFCYKAILNEYGMDYNNLPLKITGTILDLDNIQVTNDTRENYKILRHLPKGSFSEFCEIDLKKIVSRDSFDLVKEIVFNREKNRSAIKRKEKRENSKKSISDNYNPLISPIEIEPITSEMPPLTSSVEPTPVLPQGVWSTNPFNKPPEEEKPKKMKPWKKKGKGKLLFSY